MKGVPGAGELKLCQSSKQMKSQTDKTRLRRPRIQLTPNNFSMIFSTAEGGIPLAFAEAKSAAKNGLFSPRSSCPM